MIVLHYF